MKKILNIFSILVFGLILIGCDSVDFSIGIAYVEKNIYVGEYVKFTTNKEDMGLTEEVFWESSNEEIATVTQEGIVLGMAPGQASIIARVGDEEYSKVILNVLENEKEYYIEVSGKQNVLINETIKLTATVLPTSSSQQVYYKSSNEKIATVDQLGNVKGIIPGMVTIYITCSYPDVVKEIPVLVQSGNGIQDVIQNYIEQTTYQTIGNIDLTILNKQVTEFVKTNSKGVLGITNYYMKNGSRTSSYGSAAVIAKETISETNFKYTVLTNYHVVENSIELKVYLGDYDETVDATTIKTLPDYDLALVEFNYSADLPVLKIANEESLSDGDFVVAIGNPNGYDYYGSVTFGIASCAKRSLPDESPVFVQHDAAINPGNSGGPLFNLNGEIVGINTLKLVSVEIEGMGFAVSVTSINEFLNS